MEIRGVVIVTGAGSGIGRAVAQRLASLDANVLICADMNLDAAKETATACRNIERPGTPKGLDAAAHPVDVRDETSVDDLITHVAETHGRIDVLVNTAGFGAAYQTPIRDMPLADWRSLDEVHNIGCFLLTRAALRVMDRQDAVVLDATAGGRPPTRGAIVMLTSLASEGAFLGVGNYIAAKHAVKGMVQTSAIENAARGIRVNAVAPSYVSGPMMDQFLKASPDVKAAILGDLPMGRLATVGEVADAVAFLASSFSSYVNGHTLVVDGGGSLALSIHRLEVDMSVMDFSIHSSFVISIAHDRAATWRLEYNQGSTSTAIPPAQVGDDPLGLVPRRDIRYLPPFELTGAMGNPPCERIAIWGGH
ncbi:Uu.00g008300.m01.CDS01 [Anthostomella pinea]|uniref:Uu.00g008300.m01.CDS01 n=1 Tax=Anthostomella pinea TaxID=933095 RepID=A0AAI8YPZ1_9PEZI|nr:Uu.00g008300.m01.CDS01 [Anthostomella pinea]